MPAAKPKKPRADLAKVDLWVPISLLAAYRKVLATRAATLSGDVRLHMQRTVAEAAQRPSP
jgi:hypothetical protein